MCWEYLRKGTEDGRARGKMGGSEDSVHVLLYPMSVYGFMCQQQC